MKRYNKISIVKALYEADNNIIARVIQLILSLDRNIFLVKVKNQCCHRIRPSSKGTEIFS